MHDAITVGVQLLAILFGILFNQRGLDKLGARVDARFNAMDGRFNGVEARLDRMQADLSTFFRILAEHAAEIENLKRNRPT